MKVIVNKILPFGRKYHAINLFGVVFAKGECGSRTLRHEYIHTLQMRELWYLGFYILYVAEWLYRLIRMRDSYKAYSMISFEREAYANDNQEDYPSERQRFAWMRYL